MHSLTEVIRRDAEARYLKKHAHAGAIAVGLQLPSIVTRARHRYREAGRELALAGGQRLDDTVATKQAAVPPWLAQTGQQATSGFGNSVSGLGGLPLGVLATGLTRGLSGRIEDAVRPKGLGDRKDPLSIAGAAAAKAFGNAVGAAGVDLLKDIASKAVAAAGSLGDQAARNAILQVLKREDPVLSQAKDTLLMEAFHTMTRVAPFLSTDKNAVRAFLRLAATSGGGLDFTTIKLLAEAERAVTGKKGE